MGLVFSNIHQKESTYINVNFRQMWVCSMYLHKCENQKVHTYENANTVVTLME